MTDKPEVNEKAERKIALIPGSFDPVTKGHERLIERGACLFDDVTVLVCVNGEKNGMFTPEERKDMLCAVCRKYKNVRVELWNGLLADYLLLHPACVILRGARGTQDFEYETSYAAINRELCHIETVILPTEAQVAHISSTYARDLLRFGGELSLAVPNEAIDLIKKRQSNG